MKKQQLLQIIKDGGATLNKDGAPVNFENGYQVSTKDCYTIEIGNARKILRAVNKLLRGVGVGEFVGVWIDGGKAYIDISQHITGKAYAVELGRRNRQISIFDWAKNRCIYLEA